MKHDYYNIQETHNEEVIIDFKKIDHQWNTLKNDSQRKKILKSHHF